MKKIFFIIPLYFHALGIGMSSPAISSTQGNIISNNGANGVLITVSSSANRIGGNAIGTNFGGSLNMGNGQAGVAITYNSDNNTVGGIALNAGNYIAFNSKGVVVGADSNDLSINNSILSNSIYSNALIGIDLANDGPTQNHALNPTPGPNDFQNYPVLTGFTITNTGLDVSWTLHSQPTSEYRLQFFKNNGGDPEGRLLVDQFNVVTDANGNANGVISISGVPLNSPITATATVTNGDTFGNTSEFGMLVYGIAKPCVTIPCHR